MPDRQKLVYDWNLIGESEPLTDKRVLLDDETLRDGLQSPTVSDPAIEDKIHLLHLMEELGIQMVDIGLIDGLLLDQVLREEVEQRPPKFLDHQNQRKPADFSSLNEGCGLEDLIQSAKSAG